MKNLFLSTTFAVLAIAFTAHASQLEERPLAPADLDFKHFLVAERKATGVLAGNRYDEFLQVTEVPGARATGQVYAASSTYHGTWGAKNEKGYMKYYRLSPEQAKKAYEHLESVLAGQSQRAQREGSYEYGRPYYIGD